MRLQSSPVAMKVETRIDGFVSRWKIASSRKPKRIVGVLYFVNQKLTKQLEMHIDSQPNYRSMVDRLYSEQKVVGSTPTS